MNKPTKMWIIIGIILIINVVLFVFQPGGEIALKYYSDLLPIICSFISVLYLLMAVRSFKVFDKTKLAWVLLLIGIFLDFLAESTYAVSEIVFSMDMNQIFPFYADYLWCIAYVPFFVGLIIIFSGYKKSGLPMGRTGLYIAISTIVFLIVGVTIVLLLIPIVISKEITAFAKIFYLFYPIADLLTLIPAILLIYITSLFGNAKITIPWRCIAAGFVCFAIADLLYSYLSWQDLYTNGNLIDVAWNFGYLLLAMAGLYQNELVKSLK